ncbi:MAG: UvrD-helicase domain-containing protein, partial [Brachybacterium sp.]|nr:UvrD-helicase domain-containing protein [Brachybacterium sp.]
GAGSGKSTAMVRRVLALIDAGAEVTRIAAITFTERAALDLRMKIRAALDTPAPGIGFAAAARRRDALADLESAPIGTIHSFCAHLLRLHPIEAGIPPLLEQADEAATRAAFARLWRTRSRDLLDGEHREAVVVLMNAGMGPGKLRGIAAGLAADWRRTETWLRRTRAVSPAASGAESSGRPHLRALHEELTAVQGTPATGTSATAVRTVELVAAHCETTATALASDPARALPLITGMREVRPGNAVVWQDKPRTAEIRHRVNGLLGAARAEAIDALLLPLVRDIGEIVVDAARERTVAGRLQFQDLLTFARDLLTGPHRERVHAELHQQVHWILVDEFQDTDEVQAEILFRLAALRPAGADEDWRRLPLRPGHLFMVGDPKQAIYRFRGADIGTYLQVRDALREQPEGTWQIASLITNFRSDPDVLDWVNAIFDELMVEQDGVQPEYESLDVRPDAPA